jgi:hypothetical protein
MITKEKSPMRVLFFRDHAQRRNLGDLGAGNYAKAAITARTARTA